MYCHPFLGISRFQGHQVCCKIDKQRSAGSKTPKWTSELYWRVCSQCYMIDTFLFEVLPSTIRVEKGGSSMCFHMLPINFMGKLCNNRWSVCATKSATSSLFYHREPRYYLPLRYLLISFRVVQFQVVNLRFCCWLVERNCTWGNELTPLFTAIVWRL